MSRSTRAGRRAAVEDREVDPRYTIGAACSSDLPRIAAIELAAAKLLTGYAPDDVVAETTDIAQLQEALRQDRLWVARANGVPIGFAHVLALGPNALHLEELDVHPEHARRGVGRRLVSTVCEWAASNGFESLTLTAFRAVPWNMPFYARMGFEIVPPPALSDALRVIVDDEARRGLDPAARVVMRYRCRQSRHHFLR